MHNEKTIFEHEDGSTAVRLGLLPVFVGMTVFAKPNVPMVVTEVSLHIPTANDATPDPDIESESTRLFVKLANHPNPSGCTWRELH